MNVLNKELLSASIKSNRSKQMQLYAHFSVEIKVGGIMKWPDTHTGVGRKGCFEICTRIGALSFPGSQNLLSKKITTWLTELGQTCSSLESPCLSQS